MTSQFPSLDRGLISNPRLSQLVCSTFGTGYLKLLDRLFNDLYNGGCKGVDTKVVEILDLLRFQSLVSELEFARYFVQKDCQVELLPSNAFSGRKAPDMLVTNNSKDYFVEVKNIQSDDEEYNFGTAIADALNSVGKSFMVVIKSTSKLSKPAYKYETKDQKELDSKSALEEFRRKMRGIPADRETKINTAVADIELHPTKKGESYLGISAMKEVITSHGEYLERIRYDIVQKGSKRNDWSGTELDKLYLVAMDDESVFFDSDWYNIILFGPSNEFYPPLPVPEPTIDATIQHAIDLGWKEYLTRMRILRNNRSVIEDHQRGMFYNQAPMKNVTAIIVRNKTNFYLLANPFAEDRINSPNILTEMANCIIGWV